MGDVTHVMLSTRSTGRTIGDEGKPDGGSQKEGVMFKLKFAGAVAAAVVSVGMLAGAMSSARAAVLPLLSTSTALSTTTSTSTITLDATVTLELVKGALITPSGTVALSDVTGAGTTLLASPKLSSCLLGLPGLLGLTTETCSVSYTLTSADWANTVACDNYFTAVYSGGTDLVAEPSPQSSADVMEPSYC